MILSCPGSGLTSCSSVYYEPEQVVEFWLSIAIGYNVTVMTY